MNLAHKTVISGEISKNLYFSSSGWSPLLLAASNGHLDLVKIFLDVNARVDVFDQVLSEKVEIIWWHQGDCLGSTFCPPSCCRVWECRDMRDAPC